MALGSWQLGKLADRLPRKVTAFIVTQILVAVILPLEILFARSIINLAGIEPGEVVGLFPIFYCSLIVLAPLGILHGFQFALGSRILSTSSHTPAVEVGKVYISEAIGTMVGGIMVYPSEDHKAVRIASRLPVVTTSFSPQIISIASPKL